MTSLTELCSICYANPPKYTCPRCSLQSCSLDCVKTHKKRAKCNGIRNPAAYKRASELATPASIDQDYNFITKVQRDIDKADKDVAERGITLVPAGNGRNSHSSKSKLEFEYEACGVTVIKAPTGLTRSKQSHTHWDKRHKCIMWTVEWVLQDNTRVLANVRGTRNMLEALTNTFGKKSLIRKRKFEEAQAEDQSRPSAQRETQTDLKSQPTERQQMSEAETHHGPVESPEADGEDTKQLQETKGNAEGSGARGATQPGSMDNLAPQIHFYLHRPRTSSKWTCLVPIPESSSISDMLKDKTIIEFPTVYALHDPPDLLEPPFITAQKYEELNGIVMAPSFLLTTEKTWLP